MNDTFKGFPAFPCEWDYINSNRAAANGMELRDYFAIHADQPGETEIVSEAGLTLVDGFVWKSPDEKVGTFNQWYRALPAAERYRLYAKVRFALADAMLAERAK